MLDRPPEPGYFESLIAQSEAAPPLRGAGPDAQPIEGWGPEEQWASLVGTLATDIVPVRTAIPAAVHGVASVEPLGPASWRVTVGNFAEFVFRDVLTTRELSADITVTTGGVHVLRTTSTLSLHGRAALARAAIARARGVGVPEQWEDAIDHAVEAIMATVESLGDGVDLRKGDIEFSGPEFVVEPLWATGPTTLVMPGEAGKSTLARAMAVSITSGRMVVPGLYPRVTGPIMYLASEDPGERSHRLSIDAICAGAGITRQSLDHEIRLVPSRGQPLHRIARSIAERARDYAGVVLDAQNGLLPAGDSGVRDGAATFWNAVDAIDRPVFIVAHPNLAQARNWRDADGRAAGAEVHRDRARLSWMGKSSDEPSVAGTHHRLFVMSCTKRNDGPRPPDIAFRRTWSPGVVTFTPADPQDMPAKGGPLPTVSETMAATSRAWQDGARTPAAMADALAISPEAAKKRIQRMHEQGLA